jgi:hypothetical protein
LNTFGGDKKQGLTSRVGLDNWSNTAVQTYSNGYGRNNLVMMNQLGGVGAGKSMFNGRFTQVDGTRTRDHPSIVPPEPSVPPTLQVVLDAGNSANGINASIHLTDSSLGESSSLTPASLVLTSATDSATMSASTLTANGVSASWADIVDGVVNPPAPTLQSVLDAGNTASGGNAEFTLTSAIDDAVLVSPSIVQLTSADPPYLLS